MSAPEVVTITLNPSLDMTARVDELLPERKLRADGVEVEPGGGGVNVARVLRGFHVPVLAVLPAGGAAGQHLLDALGREGVPTASVPVGRETRQSVTIWEARRREHYRIVVPGAPLEESGWRGCLHMVAEAPGKPRFLVLSGSFPPGLAPHAFLAELAGLARVRGAELVADTSGAALAAAVEVGADLIKPSTAELARLAGVPEDDWPACQQAARALVGRGVGTVVVSRGQEGAFVVARDGLEAQFDPPDVIGHSAVGAGDAMVAGMLVARREGRDLAGAVRFGVAAGVAACLTPGSALCRPDDVRRLDAALVAES